jgi:SPP1 family predicted phage head-tail adaptor
MLNAGPLDQRITLQQPTPARDANGDETITWTTVREVWARVAPIKGRELFEGGASLADTDTRFVIRAAPDLQTGLSPKWRVLHRARAYNLYSVAESSMGREYIELLAKVGTNEG